VAHKDLARNRLIAVQGHDHPGLLSRHLRAADVSWVAGHPPADGRLAAKTRYRQADASCCFRQAAEDGVPGFDLDFIAPDPAQWAVTPGQSAVVYDGEVCLGGGVISQVAPAPDLPSPPATPAAAR
jgi:tRNA-specific 2-thiouridylase